MRLKKKNTLKSKIFIIYVVFSLFSLTVDRRIRKGSITEASAPGDFKINMVSTEVSNLTKAMKNKEEKKRIW
jgi:hypothetical protein